MSALDELKALGPRIDAVAAGLGNAVATAVAAQKATDDQAATDAETALQAEVTDLSGRVAALEQAANPPAP